jgi:hypothetical protein
VSLAEEARRLLAGLTQAGVAFIVVGGSGALMQGVPMVTFDLDIVPSRDAANVERLLAWLLEHGAFHRLDLANRRLPPTREALGGHGHMNLQLDLGKLDVLCELSLGEGYEELLPTTDLFELDGTEIRVLSLERIIQAKAKAGRPKDKAVLPLLLATLDERRKGKT